MKKFFLLMVGLCVLSSCSDDDDTSEDQKILGTWFLVEANNAPGYTVDECTSQSNITFNADNSATSQFYADSGSGCDSESGNGNWNKNGDTYTFAVPLYGDVTGKVSFSGDRFTFVPEDLAALGTNLVFER